MFKVRPLQSKQRRELALKAKREESIRVLQSLRREGLALQKAWEEMIRALQLLQIKGFSQEEARENFLRASQTLEIKAFSLEEARGKLPRALQSLEIKGLNLEEAQEELLRALRSKQIRVKDVPFPSWTRGECLGAGHFGKVYKCVTCDGDIFAVKIVKLYTETQEEVKALRNEILILKKLTHKRIVSYHGSQEKDGHLHLFMDFMAGGSLFAYIKKSGVLSEDESQRYTNQMLQGIVFLHSQDVIHRDIKGSNVLLDGKGNVKLADFGLSKMIQKVGSKTKLTSHCGTLHWMAPEILWGKGYGRKADIWSLGCTVVEMLTGKPPLGDLEPAAAMYNIGFRPTEPTLPETASQDAKEFIRAALTWKPEERPSSDDLQRFKFVSKRNPGHP